MGYPSRRARLVAALMERLANIRPDNGFATDLGLRVLFGHAELGDDDKYPACCLVLGETVEVLSGNKWEVTLPVDVEILALADPTDPLRSIEDPIEDVRRALWPPAWVFTAAPHVIRWELGTVRPLPREPASNHVGASRGMLFTFLEDADDTDA